MAWNYSSAMTQRHRHAQQAPFPGSPTRHYPRFRPDFRLFLFRGIAATRRRRDHHPRKRLIEQRKDLVADQRYRLASPGWNSTIFNV